MIFLVLVMVFVAMVLLCWWAMVLLCWWGWSKLRDRRAATAVARAAPGVFDPDDPVQARLRKDVERIAQAPRNLATHAESLTSAKDYVKECLEKAGWDVQVQPFTAPAGVGITDHGSGRQGLAYRRRTLNGSNLLAARPSPRSPAGPLLIAHIDSVRTSQGADDNAASVAILLEVGRRLTEQAPTSPVRLAVVDAEELGKLGSTALRDGMPILPTSVIALDAVGYCDPRPGTQRLPGLFKRSYPTVSSQIAQRDDAGDFTLAVHRADAAHLAQSWYDAAAANDQPTILCQDRRATATTKDLVSSHFDRSDHAPFWAIEIPGLLLTDTINHRNPHYHMPSDTPDTLHYPTLARITAALTTTLQRI